MRRVIPIKPSAFAEQTLISQIVSGKRRPGESLPAERLLAQEISVTRPTLRETLKQLHRDGWIEIQHGKSTRVRDFWCEGGLNLLNGLVHAEPKVLIQMITHLLDVRIDLAPAYTRAALTKDPTGLMDFLRTHPARDDCSEVFCDYDWTLHQRLTHDSGNPIYRLILNGFETIYRRAGRLYFAETEARNQSHRYYRDLMQHMTNGDVMAAVNATRQAMIDSRALWTRMGG